MEHLNCQCYLCRESDLKGEPRPTTVSPTMVAYLHVDDDEEEPTEKVVVNPPPPELRLPVFAAASVLWAIDAGPPPEPEFKVRVLRLVGFGPTGAAIYA
jgi:hypothetical protein